MHNSQKTAGAILFRKIDSHYEVLLVYQWNSVWSFPKGSIDIGETSEITAQRELYEETDIKFGINKFKDIALIYWQKFYLFDCTALDVNYNLKSSEITEVKWVNISDINNYKINSFLKRFIFLKERFIKQFEVLKK